MPICGGIAIAGERAAAFLDFARVSYLFHFSTSACSRMRAWHPNPCRGQELRPAVQRTRCRGIRGSFLVLRIVEVNLYQREVDRETVVIKSIRTSHARERKDTSQVSLGARLPTQRFQDFRCRCARAKHLWSLQWPFDICSLVRNAQDTK